MIETILCERTCQALKEKYHLAVDPAAILIQKTKKEFEGDLTVVIFPLSKLTGTSPQSVGEEIGLFLKDHVPEIQSFEVVRGFLNIKITDVYWKEFFIRYHQDDNFGLRSQTDDSPIVIEYSSPNTNKPLHLGHIRNNLLGYSLSQILNANGRKVVKVNLVNDRGIHICKSMLAWEKWSRGETPLTAGMKGDHLIGKYYVLFEKKYREEVERMMEQGMTEEDALKKAPLILEAQQLLKKWESKDAATVRLWKMMNEWAYEGFEETYQRMGVGFDRVYYESDTYLLGKKMVEEGLQKGVVFRKEDGSVWVDLSAQGMDEKLLLRPDGTSVYITQDLGTAQLRFDEFHPGRLIYVVGNEQIYHFNVLKATLKKLGRDWADNIFHLSYGMVELPQGKMKSREGKVVDADDLMDEMVQTSGKMTAALGKTEGLSEKEADMLIRMVGMAALKYFILKVDPMKTMLFNPEESIDFTGNTGPFIQYTHARIRSLLRKALEEFNYVSPALSQVLSAVEMNGKERAIVMILHDFPSVVREAAETYNPASIANYVYELAKEYNQFYQEYPVLREENKAVSDFRIELSAFTGRVIKKAMNMLGIEVPERM
jgi:arginyl-tRNA synthetase